VKLSIDTAGAISLLTTFTDQGTGCYTIMCEIVAEVLRVPVDKI